MKLTPEEYDALTGIDFWTFVQRVFDELTGEPFQDNFHIQKLCAEVDRIPTETAVRLAFPAIAQDDEVQHIRTRSGCSSMFDSAMMRCIRGESRGRSSRSNVSCPARHSSLRSNCNPRPRRGRVGQDFLAPAARPEQQTHLYLW